MAVHNLQTKSELEDKVFSARDDKVILLHPFFVGMSEKPFAAEMGRLSELYHDLCCYSVDIGKVTGAYEALGIKGLPVVMFFKNGDKIGELIGCNKEKEIKVILQRHMPKIEADPSPHTGDDGKAKELVSSTTAMDHGSIPSRDKRQEVQPGSCSICDLEKIAMSLPSHPSDDTVYGHRKIDISKLVGNIDNCSYCRFLVQSFRTDPALLGDFSAGRETAQLLTKRDIGLARIDFEGRRKVGSKSIPLFKARCLQMAPESEDSSSQPHFSGRVVGNQANIDLCRSWHQLCKNSHPSTCQEEIIDIDKIGLRLIDVEDRSVVNVKDLSGVYAPRIFEYAALSYVWGDAKQLKLEKGTIERLISARGLSDDEYDDIPKTISDAMKVTSLLGLRYLWVDALCIQQDDLADKERQIGQMDRIYCCASLTIVGTGPSANSGLPGLHQSSRSPNQTLCEIGDIKLLSSLPTLSFALSASVWDKRAWTLQEKALSERLLIFTSFQVYWHCNSAVYAEDTILENTDTKVGLRRAVENYEEYSAELRLIYKPSLKSSASDQYVSFLRSYVRRDISYQSDALLAFSGVLNSLESKLGNHLWGLPTRDFDRSMLWACDGHFPKRRRYGFPSWSWAGWKGGKDVNMLESGASPSARIWWWRMDDAGEFVLVNPSNKDAENSGYNNEFFGVNSSSEPPRPSDIFEEETLPVPLPSHILRFWTSAANFSIGRKPVSKPGGGSLASTSDCSEYHVYIPGQKTAISSVILDNKWREERGDVDNFEVIFLSRIDKTSRFKYDIKVWTMLIECHDGIAYRVQQFLFPIRFNQWEAAKPQFKLISLM